MTKENNRYNVKFVLSKVFLLLFCVIFISTYKSAYGVENNLVGVMLLTGLLIYMGSDFGYDAKYAAILIPTGFMVMGVLAKLSNLNPFIGIISSIIAIKFVFMISKGDKNGIVYLPLIMGYIMFKGEDVSGSLFVNRIVSLFVVGGIIGLIYFLINKKKEYNTPYKDMMQNFSDEKSYKRWKILLMVTLVVSMFVEDMLQLEKGMWLNLATFSLIPPGSESIRERKLSRVPATILGSVICIIVFGAILPQDYHPIALLIGGFLSMFMTGYLSKTTVNSFSALGAATMIMPIHEAVKLRILSNVIALIIAIVSMYVFKRIFSNKDNKECLNKETVSA